MSSVDSADFDTAETDDFESFDTDEASLEMESSSRSSSPASADAVVETAAVQCTPPPPASADAVVETPALHSTHVGPTQAAARGLPPRAGVQERRAPRSHEDDPMQTFDARFASILQEAQRRVA